MARVFSSQVANFMRVRVLIFGILNDFLPAGKRVVDLPDGATVDHVLRWFRERAPEDRRDLWPALAVAVNQQYARRDCELHEGDEVALLPPVSGGSDEQSLDGYASIPKIALVRTTIDSTGILSEIKSPSDGAVASFDGIVRDNSRGRKTRYLVYEAYEAMALEVLKSLRLEAIQAHGVRDVVIHHRLGRLEIGETSVLIAAAAAHRAPAFDACRWLIDTLKKKVPIWKREHFLDGAVWADGEAFPAELTQAPLPVTKGARG